MRTVRLALWILAAIVASTACHGPETEVEQEHATTTAIEKQPTTTAVEGQPSTTAALKQQSTTTTEVEECSWCPAPDPAGTAAAQQATSPQADLIDQLQSTAGGTAFADVSEDQLQSDIRTICETWKGDTSLEDAAARVSLARSEMLGASQSEPGLAAYTRLLKTLADQRCLRDPTR